MCQCTFNHLFYALRVSPQRLVRRLSVFVWANDTAEKRSQKRRRETSLDTRRQHEVPRLTSWRDSCKYFCLFSSLFLRAVTMKSTIIWFSCCKIWMMCDERMVDVRQEKKKRKTENRLRCRCASATSLRRMCRACWKFWVLRLRWLVSHTRDYNKYRFSSKMNVKRWDWIISAQTWTSWVTSTV